MSARNSKNSVCFWWWQWLANSLGSNATKSLHDLHVSRWFWENPIQCSPLYTLGILNNPKDCSRLRLKTLHLPHFIWHKVKGVACSRQCYLAQGRWPQRPWSQLCSNTDSCVSNKHGCIILWYNISIYWYIYIIYIYWYILIELCNAQNQSTKLTKSRLTSTCPTRDLAWAVGGMYGIGAVARAGRTKLYMRSRSCSALVWHG